MKKILSFFLIFLFCMPVFAKNWDINEGKNLFFQNKNNEAKVFFEDFVKIYPNNIEAYYYLGLIYKKENNLVASRNNFTKSYNLTNNITDVKIAPNVEGLPLEDYFDMAQMFFEGEDFENALIYANLLEELSPSDAKNHYLKAQIYLAKNNKEAGYNSFLKALGCDLSYLDSELAQVFEVRELPNFNDNFYNSKGLQFFYAGELELAYENFKTAIDKNFANSLAYNNLGNLFYIKSDLKSARKYFKKARLFDFRNSLYYRNLAKTYNNLQKKYYLKKAISLNPNDKYSYFELAQYYSVAKKYDVAIENYKKTLMLDENFIEAYLGLIDIFINTDKYDDAILYVRDALRKAPDNPEIYFYLAKLSEAQKDYKSAYGYLSNALKNAENDKYRLELLRIEENLK
ncbi:MAG: tetratricopeptide repeat protein [Cyanobacteria bacterium SIG30]|nr:tetratricopeptide repeat protein [Cyanobacteria bacterium SIG30]